MTELGKKREIAVAVGSPRDLEQCVEGLELLCAAEERGEIEWVYIGGEWSTGQIACDQVLCTSVHRNPGFTDQVFASLKGLGVDVIITGAGQANHLSGSEEARLRNLFGNLDTVVVAVAFEDLDGDKENTMAACLATSQIPGTQCVYKDGDGYFVGATGFERACRYALTCELPVSHAVHTKPPKAFSGQAAIQHGLELRQKRTHEAAMAATEEV